VGNTNYTLSGANPNGCSATTVITLPVNPLPIVNLSASSVSVCIGNSVNLLGSGNAVSYSWTTGQTTASISIAPSSTSVYSLTGYNAVGCEKTATVAVAVDGFTPGITSSTTICQGESIQLQATGASTLLWNTGSVFSSITVTPNITTTYSVTGKGANNCQGSNETTVTVNPTPTVQAAASRSVICRGESSVLTASGAATYVWNTGATSPTIALSPTTTAQQLFTVTGTNNAGCTATAQVSLKANTCQGLQESTSELSVSVFPNPGSGVYHVSLGAQFLGGQWEATDLVGSAVAKSTIESLDTQIDLSAMANGYYIISLRTEDGFTISKKVLKH
jgi:hypothetical protein